jgi:hypothetical protein
MAHMGKQLVVANAGLFQDGLADHHLMAMSYHQPRSKQSRYSSSPLPRMKSEVTNSGR